MEDTFVPYVKETKLVLEGHLATTQQRARAYVMQKMNNVFVNIAKRIAGKKY
jgi:Fe-S cluster biosynthesis and repair protein YggX